MLIKLGEVWVDPSEVRVLELSQENIQILLSDRVTNSSGDIDNFAYIINTALSTQSFGGAEDEKENIAVS